MKFLDNSIAITISTKYIWLKLEEMSKPSSENSIPLVEVVWILVYLCCLNLSNHAIQIFLSRCIIKNSHLLEIERFFDNFKSIVLLKVGTRFVRSGFGWNLVFAEIWHFEISLLITPEKSALNHRISTAFHFFTLKLCVKYSSSDCFLN